MGCEWHRPGRSRGFLEVDPGRGAAASGCSASTCRPGSRPAASGRGCGASSRCWTGPAARPTTARSIMGDLNSVARGDVPRRRRHAAVAAAAAAVRRRHPDRRPGPARGRRLDRRVPPPAPRRARLHAAGRRAPDPARLPLVPARAAAAGSRRARRRSTRRWRPAPRTTCRSSRRSRTWPPVHSAPGDAPGIGSRMQREGRACRARSRRCATRSRSWSGTATPSRSRASRTSSASPPATRSSASGGAT